MVCAKLPCHVPVKHGGAVGGPRQGAVVDSAVPRVRPVASAARAAALPGRLTRGCPSTWCATWMLATSESRPWKVLCVWSCLLYLCLQAFVPQRRVCTLWRTPAAAAATGYKHRTVYCVVAALLLRQIWPLAHCAAAHSPLCPAPGMLATGGLQLLEDPRVWEDTVACGLALEGVA